MWGAGGGEKFSKVNKFLRAFISTYGKKLLQQILLHTAGAGAKNNDKIWFCSYSASEMIMDLIGINVDVKNNIG
jgi:hypothetical protein